MASMRDVHVGQIEFNTRRALTSIAFIGLPNVLSMTQELIASMLGVRREGIRCTKTDR